MKSRMVSWRLGWSVIATLFAGAMAMAGPPADQAVAVVNGEKILLKDFEHAWKRLPAPPITLSQAERKTLQMQLLDLMIDEVLFKQFLRRNVPEPDPALVQKRVDELVVSLRSRGRTLEDYLKETGQTEAGLREDIATVVRWNAYVARHVTDKDLKRCFDEHQEMLSGALVRASHVFIAVPPNAPRADHQRAIAKLQSIRRDIEKGLSFVEAAKKHSQDSPAVQGGDLGYFPPSRTDKDPFMRAVATLPIGKISAVVHTPYGYHLIRVTDRRPGKRITFESVREDCRALAAEELRVRIVEQERRKAKMEIHLP